MLLVECVNPADKARKLVKGEQYIVTKNVLGLDMWYMLKGLEGEAAYPAEWFRIVNANYSEPISEKDNVEEKQQLSLF